jgi:hypothetical protein
MASKRSLVQYKAERIEPMERIHVLWNLFAVTGNIDAYLLYKDCSWDEQGQELNQAGVELS